MTGQIVAIYNEQEGEVEVGPCMLGATTLMAPAHRAFACLPCGYRTLNSCMLWEVPLQELMPVRRAAGCTILRKSANPPSSREGRLSESSPALAPTCWCCRTAKSGNLGVCIWREQRKK